MIDLESGGDPGKLKVGVGGKFKPTLQGCFILSGVLPEEGSDMRK